MSTVKLTLRPPPNVDFVHGYPGIPPQTPDRPQAAVKGAIEVRVGPSGVKAKWVRISLRKVETLPGGGQANTFYDFVGPSPVNLWQASEEYAILQTQDFPFYIRIPESIPPSIALEKGAGIKYELYAAVCTKGKRGILRQRKSIVTSTMAPIVIDKHELHSTWPIYCQPDIRHLDQDGVRLTAERTHTCYGPGDRVSVMATLKSDALHTVILRGFEFTLKESTIFRAGHLSGKKGAPQVKQIVIGEQKVPVNATLYGGTQHRAELACTIPATHTTTSMNAARHIDITYTINVKALMGTGTHLIMDLPVIVSNWPRVVSSEAIRRIGPAPSLSLLPPNATPRVPQPAWGSPTQTSSSVNTHSPASSPMPHSNPVRPTSNSLTHSNVTNGISDELGYGRPTTSPGVPTGHRTTGSFSGNRAPEPSPPAERRSSIGSRHPRSGGNATNRLTITNISDDSEIPTEQPRPPQPTRTPWPVAEEEKKRLYEQARADVERVQGGVVRSNTVPVQAPPVKSPVHVDAGRIVAPVGRSASSRTSPWPTAEEEKAKLFEQAQATAKRTQAFGTPYQQNQSTPASNAVSPSQGASSLPSVSAGAALYSHAMSSLNKPTGGQAASGSAKVSSPAAAAAPMPASSSTSAPAPAPAPVKAPVPQYMSAEEEKAALRRYHEAKLAVDRTQFSSSDEGANPVPYDSLYPGAKAGSSPTSQPPSEGSPSPVSQQPAWLNEKEKLRRAYEAQDAARMQQQNAMSPITPQSAPASSSPPPPSGSPPSFAGPSSSSSAMVEKEMLRKKYEAQDLANGSPSATAPQPPPPRAGRSIPVPPTAGNSRPLTAAEEKAQLRKKFEAEEQNTRNPNGTEIGSAAPTSPPPATLNPPPLAPKPPMEYIQETQEEDARVSRVADVSNLSDNIANGHLTPSPSNDHFGRSPTGSISGRPGPPPPPPLPPKVPLA